MRVRSSFWYLTAEDVKALRFTCMLLPKRIQYFFRKSLSLVCTRKPEESRQHYQSTTKQKWYSDKFVSRGLTDKKPEESNAVSTVGISKNHEIRRVLTDEVLLSRRKALFASYLSLTMQSLWGDLSGDLPNYDQVSSYIFHLLLYFLFHIRTLLADSSWTKAEKTIDVISSKKEDTIIVLPCKCNIITIVLPKKSCMTHLSLGSNILKSYTNEICNDLRDLTLLLRVPWRYLISWLHAPNISN